MIATAESAMALLFFSFGKKIAAPPSSCDTGDETTAQTDIVVFFY